MQDGAPRRPDAAQPRDLRPTRFGIPTPPRPRRNGKNKKDSGARSLRGCSNHSDYRRHRSRCPEKRDIIESIEQSRVPETSDQSEATTLHWSVRLHFLLSPRLYISRKQAQKFRSPVILNPKKKKTSPIKHPLLPRRQYTPNNAHHGSRLRTSLRAYSPYVNIDCFFGTQLLVAYLISIDSLEGSRIARQRHCKLLHLTGTLPVVYHLTAKIICTLTCTPRVALIRQTPGRIHDQDARLLLLLDT